ncbi:hypothetical protein MWU38_02525 [Qipengyuania sp. S6317L1]|nr:hypothetical protein [Qipengyuania sp. S6317L1]
MGRDTVLRSSAIDQNAIIRTARRLFEERQSRSDHFPLHDLFGEPAWDILLLLFIAQAKGKGAKIENLSITSKIPARQALRWLEKLESRQMVFAYRDEDNPDEVFVRLTFEGRSSMTRYLQQISRREKGKYQPSPS